MDTTNKFEPKVVICLYDLTLWYLQRTNRFPKNYRITLGDKIDNLLLEMLKKANLARLRKDRINLLIEINEGLEALRIFTRLGNELGCLKSNQYEYVSHQIDEIGRQIGGWIKHQDKKK